MSCDPAANTARGVLLNPARIADLEQYIAKVGLGTASDGKEASRHTSDCWTLIGKKQVLDETRLKLEVIVSLKVDFNIVRDSFSIDYS